MAATPETRTELAPPSWEDGERYDLSFAVGKSRRYHAMMAGFYRGCHRFVVASSALTGTSAFVALLSGSPGIAKWLTALVAVAATLDLVFAFSEQADKQDQLRRRFTELAARMVAQEPTAENVARASAERLRIEAEDAEEKRLVDLQAQNDEARARGVAPGKLVPLSRPQRWFGYFATFGMKRLEAWAATQEIERRAAAGPPLA